MKNFAVRFFSVCRQRTISLTAVLGIMVAIGSVQYGLAQGSTCIPQGTQMLAYDANNDHLYKFTASNPGSFLSDVELTGLTPDEFIFGIDYRPSNGQLYAGVTNIFGLSTQIYSANTTTGQLSPIGMTSAGSSDVFFGIDFNPAADRIRVVGNSATNRRFHPDTGDLVANDMNLTYAPGDPNAGSVPNIVHVAYSNNQAGASTTTLYGIDSAKDTLVRIGGVDGTPSPNDGQVFTIGPLGVNALSYGAMDIQPGTNQAYAVLLVLGASTLYSIDLTTGAATSLGQVGGADRIDGLAVLPCMAVPDVEVSGRVTTPEERGVRNAIVRMTDSNNQTRTTRTSTFGYYVFTDVPVGGSFTMGVAAKRYQFPTQMVQVSGPLTDVDFVAEEE